MVPTNRVIRTIRGVPYIRETSKDGKYSHWVVAIKVTTWHPDTCGCIINYWWDRRLSAEKRVHLYCSEGDLLELRPDVFWRNRRHIVRHRRKKDWRWEEKTCVAHRCLSGDVWLAALSEENGRKNLVLKEAQSIVEPERVLTVIEEYELEDLSPLAKWIMPKVQESIAVAMLIRATPELRADPELGKKFRDEVLGYFYRWSFDSKRRLIADFPDLQLTEEQLMQLQGLCDDKFGKRKVLLSLKARSRTH